MRTVLAVVAVFALTIPVAAHAVPNLQTQEHMAEAASAASMQSGGLTYMQVAQARNPRAQRGGARAQRQGVRTQRQGAGAQRQGVRTQRQGVRTQRQGAGAQRQSARTQRQGVRTQRQGAGAQRQGVRTQRQSVRTQRQGVRTQRQGAQGQGRARANAQNTARPNARPNVRANRPEPPRADRRAWGEWTAQRNNNAAARHAPRDNAPAARPAARHNPQAVARTGPRHNPRANIRSGARRGGGPAAGGLAHTRTGPARGDWRNGHRAARPNFRDHGAFQTARPNFPHQHQRHRTFIYHGNHHPSLLVGVFHYPSGTSYRSWRRGDFLPGLFFTAQFFFTDYTRLGVDPPPPGYRWVRYGPDLLLIDIYTYEVVEVLYGVFYW